MSLPMKTAAVTWLTDMTFDVQMGNHHLVLDTAPPSGHDRGASPMSLALAALAGCTAMDIVSILKKGRQPLKGLTVRAEGERSEEHPHRYVRVTLVYEIYGEGVDAKAVERAIALSEEKYCSVSATFKEPTEIATRYELLPSQGDDGHQ